jgi:hypothetical protein
MRKTSPLLDEQSEASSQTSVQENDYMQRVRPFERRNGPLDTRWPGLVGDCVDRGEAIVRYGSPYYVISVPYKERLSGRFRPGQQDPLRVIFYLDQHGYIATTPYVG